MCDIIHKCFKIVSDEMKFIDLNGKNVLLYGGYTFSRWGAQKLRNFYCSRRQGIACPAKINFNEQWGIRNHSILEHNHDPPQIALSSSGKYYKLN